MNVLSGLKQFAGVDDQFSHSVNLPCYYSSISEQPSLSPLERIGEACIGLRSDWSFASHRAVRQASCTTAVMFHPLLSRTTVLFRMLEQRGIISSGPQV